MSLSRKKGVAHNVLVDMIDGPVDLNPGFPITLSHVLEQAFDCLVG